MASNSLRIPFHVAIEEPGLLKKRFEQLSLPQQVALKVTYGCPLSHERKDSRGWSEIDYYAMLQGFGDYDELGYLKRLKTGAPDYTPREWRESTLVMGIRAGKALALDTPIPTPTGLTPLADVQVGATVYGSSGQPVTVIATSPVWHARDCYAVCFDNGERIVADAEHRWTVHNLKNGTVETLTTVELIAKGVHKAGGKQVRFAIPVAPSLQKPEAELPLDPYVLGVWLGDGSSYRGEICTADAEVWESFTEAGYPPTYGGTNISRGVQGLYRPLRLLGVIQNKHIPAEYLQASADQRLALLQGLMDSDGSCSKRGECEFSNTNERLAGQVVELAASLGIKVKAYTKQPFCRYKGHRVAGALAYIVRFKTERPVFRLPRKLARQKPSRTGERHFIKAIEPVKSVPVKCIAVDSADHLYLAGESGIATHNTDAHAAVAATYEAICGGHEAFLRKGKRAFVFVIAQDLRFARHSLPGILSTIEMMPAVHQSEKRSMIKRSTADLIELRNGITIAVVPPSVKAVRGYDSPVAIMDEVGVWPQEADSANPDFEIYRQVHSRQAQFEDPKIILVSSPWTKAGLLYERWLAGTEGADTFCSDCRDNVPIVGCTQCVKARSNHKNRLVMHTTTAAFGNPLVTKTWLDSAAQDPKAFERECLAQFVDAVHGFLDISLLEKATNRGVIERAPTPSAFYVAAIDPAFRNDAFGLCISHVGDNGEIYVDLLRRWQAEGGVPLNPSTVLDEIVPLLSDYRVVEVVSDQHNIDTLQQLALLRGFGLRQVTFTGRSKAQMYGNLQQLLNQGKLKLLDNEETLRELRAIERKIMPGGTVRIQAPKGSHDDMATVVALAAHQAMWLAPSIEVEIPKPPTLFELCQAHIDRKKGQAAAVADQW